MKAMFLKAKRLSLLGGLLVLAHTGAAAESSKSISIVEINGPFGQYISHDKLVFVSNSKLTVSLESRQKGWKTEKLYYTTASPGLFCFGTAVDLNYALENRTASEVLGWEEPSEGVITCDYDSDSEYNVLVICHEPYTYNVAFDANGGSGTTTGMSGLSYTNTTTKLTKNGFTRTGYTFAGWAKTATGDKAYGDEDTVGGEKFGVTSDGQTITLYAKWTPITYKVSYNADGGMLGSSAPTSATYDTAFSVSAPTKTGYTFTGWKVSGHDSSTACYGADSNCGRSVGSTGSISNPDSDTLYFKNLTTTLNGTVTLAAQWTANKTTVSFNTGASDASGGPSSTTISYGTKAQSMPVSPFSKPTRDGYTFAGYYTAANGGGTKYFDDTGLLVTDWLITDSSVTLFAAWTPITYTVTFDKTDGSGTVPSSLTKKYDETFELPDGASLTKSGYKFNGWALTSGGSAVQQAGNEVTVSQYKSWLSGTTLTFYAAWALNTKTVYFSANGGSVSPGSVTVEIGQAIGDLPTPTYSGGKKIFAGWFTAASGGTQVTATTLVTSDLSTLYAHWKNATYTIRFNGSDNTSGTMADQAVEFNVATNLSANAFQRTGYTFLGWATTATATSYEYADKASVRDLASSANATVNLYAVWTANTYYVAFDPNGGSGTMQMLTNRYDVSFALPSCTFTVPAFSTFGGWSDAANAKTYAAGATVKNLTATDGATVTLTAIWNSTLSDLSQAMHCTNLVWEADEPSSRVNTWEAIYESGIGHETDSCARQMAGSVLEQRLLAAKPGAVGVLTFFVKTTADGVSVVYMLSKARSPTDILTAAKFVTPDKDEWTQIKIEINEADVDKYVLIAAINTKGNGACLIDGMTWTPGDAEEHPEPTADDAVTISGLTATDGGFTLSYTGDENFAYRVLYTDSLASPIVWLPYGSLTNDTGASGSQTFTLTRDASVPMRFFKVETIRRP